MSIRKLLVLTTTALLWAALASAARADGDVFAFVDDGTLYVLGDKQANHVIIKRSGNAVRLKGDATGSGGDPSSTGWRRTLINSEVIVDFQLVNDIVALMGGGDDRVWIDFRIDDEFAIHTCVVDTGAGDDRVDTLGLLGNLSINTGKDADRIEVSALIPGDLTIETGNGSDEVRFSYSVIGGFTDINTGMGNDTVRFLSFPGEYAVIFCNLLISLGQGNDILNFVYEFEVPHVVVTGDALFIGGQGEDSIQFGNALDVGGMFDVLGFE